MRTAWLLPLLLLAPALAPPATALAFPVDGVTAKLHAPGSVGDAVFLQDGNGDYVVEVSVYRNVGGTWTQVAMGVTLRAFTFDPLTQTEESRVSKNFRASATGPVSVRFPASAVGAPNTFDLFLTFSDLGGAPVPTSHHNPIKNAAIDAGLFDVAEQLDYHANLRPLGL